MFARISFLLVLTLLVLTRQTMLEAGLNKIGGFDFSPLGENLHALFTSPLVLGAIAIGGVTAFTWYWLLSRLPSSVAATSLGIMLVIERMFAAWWFLGETIPTTRWIGAVVASVGIWLISR